MNPRLRIGKVGIDRCGIDEATGRIIAAALEGRGCDVHLVNASSIALADDDATYADALNAGWLNLPDGRPLGWASRMFGDDPPLGQVRGADLMRSVFAAGAGSGVRHFLLGSTEQTLATLDRSLTAANPGVSIVGSESRPFRPLGRSEQQAEMDRIRQSGANVVWISLGSRYQDLEASSLARDLDAVCIGIGAAFEFIAGNFREAPRLVRMLGLEWAFRLAQEPARLWRRYLFGNIGFIRAAIVGRRRDAGGAAGDGHG